MSDDESPPSSVGMPGSPPDLSLSCSKSSKSSFHSYQSDDNDTLDDAAHFEEIGLDDEIKSEAESGDFVNDLPFKSPFANGDKKARSKSVGVTQRDLTAKAKARQFKGLRGHGHARKPTGDVGLGLNLVPGGPPRRNMSAQSMTGLSAAYLNRNRSPSPGLSPHSAPGPGVFPTIGTERRGSWQSNSSRKTTKELEQECDDEDGDDIPDECFLPNVPMSPRPPNERVASAPPITQAMQKRREKSRPAGNGTPPVPVAQGSLRQPSKPSSPTLKPPRAKSWTAAMSDLSIEAKELTEALEAHADENNEFNPALRQRRMSNVVKPSKRSRSVVSQLPPLRRNDLMIDPLPVSREKMAVLSRTRPSWLPPKDPQEEKRHLKQYQAMMAASMKAEEKRESKTQIECNSRDDLNSSLLRIWEDHVLPNWEAATSLKRTRELWWRGVAPRSRGRVWMRAIGNELGLTQNSYTNALKRAKAVEKRLAKGNEAEEDTNVANALRRIKADVGKTFPDLRIFGEGGPLNESLTDVLMAYAVYRSDVGYVDGLNTCAALLLLNLPTSADSFIALANLLNRSLPLSFHTLDSAAISRIYTLILELTAQKFPRVFNHLCKTANFQENPGALVDETLMGLFTGHLSLDCVTRLWDVWVFEGDRVLVRGMVALFGELEAKLMDCVDEAEVMAAMKVGLTNVNKEEDWIEAVKQAGRLKEADA